MRLSRIVALLALWLSASSASRADVAFPMAGYERLALADGIFLGRVVGIEPQDIKLTHAPGAAKGEYRVAVVTVLESIHGVKEKKTVRVAFPVPAKEVEGPRRRPVFQFNLQVGNEGVFFLRKHFEEPLFVGNYLDYVSKENGDHKNDVHVAKEFAKVAADPLASLKAKDSGERFLAAATLIYRYRTPQPNQTKQQAIGAEETEQVFSALFATDWNVARRNARPIPWNLFLMLGADAKDGYQPPQNVEGGFNGLRQYVQDWRKTEKGSKFEIKRYVADK